MGKEGNPPFPSPTPLLPLFCSRLIFRAARTRKNSFARPEFRLRGTGTLVTQASALFAEVCYPWRPEANRNICHWVLLQERKFISRGTQKQCNTTFSNARTVQIAKFPEISLGISHFLTSSQKRSLSDKTKSPYGTKIGMDISFQLLLHIIEVIYRENQYFCSSSFRDVMWKPVLDGMLVFRFLHSLCTELHQQTSRAETAFGHLMLICHKVDHYLFANYWTYFSYCCGIRWQSVVVLIRQVQWTVVSHLKWQISMFWWLWFRKLLEITQTDGYGKQSSYCDYYFVGRLFFL